MSGIYTKTGDEGETGLLGGLRVAKDEPRIEAYGTVDELNAALGVARASGPPDEMNRLLESIQHDLFVIGAELAAPGEAARGVEGIGADRVQALESAIDRADAALPPLKQFILPAGVPLAVDLHLARTVCRRAERRIVTLGRVESQAAVSQWLVPYLNRLGDLLFVLAREANAAAGVGDQPWLRPPA